MELVGIGLPPKACSVLNGQAPVAPTREVVDEMRTKHPAASQPISWEALRPVHGAAAPILDDDLVRKAIKSFPKDSACGPCGLRPQHIRDAMVPGFEDELIRQLSALVNLLARGEAAPDARPFFCGATLVALRKEDATHRPIAVGETLQRLVCKSLAMVAKADARDILEPLQVGVGTPGGVEAVPHVCRKWFAMHSQDQNRVLANLDIENAFNSLNRQESVAATRALFPSLAPWVDWSYGETSFVRIGDARISSERGVQQGDPLGPLLFSLALHRAVGRVKLRVPAECPGILDFSVAYLDDMFVAGTDDAVAWFCEALSSELGSMGLSTSTHTQMHPYAQRGLR